jgi:hypothetical protein
VFYAAENDPVGLCEIPVPDTSARVIFMLGWRREPNLYDENCLVMGILNMYTNIVLQVCERNGSSKYPAKPFAAAWWKGVYCGPHRNREWEEQHFRI